jgi:GTPase Era involved in 16S rRNA processing
MTELLRKLQTICDRSRYATLSQRVEDELEKLREHQLYLVVVGQFKRGKSTFLNAVLGEDILPVGVVPLTAIVTFIRHGLRRHIDVVFTNGQRLSIEQERLHEFVSETNNPANYKNVRCVEIFHPSSFLEDGITLIDTPGIGSNEFHNTATTLDFVPNIDAAIVVLSPDPPITEAEAQFVETLVQHLNTPNSLVFVLNKADTLPPDQLREVERYTLSALNKRLGVTPALYTVSARQALDARRKHDTAALRASGLPEIEHNIITTLHSDREMLLTAASVRRTREILAEALSSCNLEYTALTMPLAELQRKTEMFRLEAERLQHERDTFLYILSNEITNLQEWILSSIRAFERQEISSLQRYATEHPINLRNTQAQKTFEEELTNLFVQHCEQWRREHEPEIQRRYERVTNDYATNINAFIERVLALSSEIFQVRLQMFPAVQTLQWKDRFYYQTTETTPLLDVSFVSTFAAALLPPTLARNILVMPILKRREEIISRNCGSLRYEYAYSIQESFRTFSFDMSREAERIVQEIYAIALQAAKQHQQDNAAAQEAVQTLEHNIQTILYLQQCINTP